MEIKFLNRKIVEEKILEKENKFLEPLIKRTRQEMHVLITGMIKATTPEAHNYYLQKAIDYLYNPRKTYDEFLEEFEYLPEEWKCFKIKKLEFEEENQQEINQEE